MIPPEHPKYGAAQFPSYMSVCFLSPGSHSVCIYVVWAVGWLVVRYIGPLHWRGNLIFQIGQDSNRTVQEEGGCLSLLHFTAFRYWDWGGRAQDPLREIGLMTIPPSLSSWISGYLGLAGHIGPGAASPLICL
jgi:hypothetical protein